MRRFFGKKDDGDTQATRVNLPGESKMYYCPEKKRWRTRGEEHLEKEEEVAAPPPMMGAKSAATAEPKPAAKAATGLDAMLAVPTNPYAQRLAQPKPAQPPQPPQAPLGAFGQPAPSPSEEPEGNTADAGGAPVAVNPFAPKGLGAQNPNAPRGFGGAAANPNAPRGFQRERPKRAPPAKPKPPSSSMSPFAAAMGNFHNIPVPKVPAPVPMAPADGEMQGEGQASESAAAAPWIPNQGGVPQGEAAGSAAGSGAIPEPEGGAPGGMAMTAPVTAPVPSLVAAPEMPTEPLWGAAAPDVVPAVGGVPGGLAPVAPPMMAVQEPAMAVQPPAMGVQAPFMAVQAPAMAVQPPAFAVPSMAEPMMAVQPPAFSGASTALSGQAQEHIEEEDVPDMPADEATLQQMPARHRRRVLEKELVRRLAEMSEAPRMMAEFQTDGRGKPREKEAGESVDGPADLQEKQQELDQKLQDQAREYEQKLGEKQSEVDRLLQEKDRDFDQQLREKEQQLEKRQMEQEERAALLEQRHMEQEAREHELARRAADGASEEAEATSPQSVDEAKQALMKEAESAAASYQNTIDMLKEHTMALERELEQERSKSRESEAARERAQTELSQERERARSPVVASFDPQAQGDEALQQQVQQEAQRRELAERDLARERRESADRLKLLADKLEAAEGKRHEVEARALTLERRLQELAEEESRESEAAQYSVLSPERPRGVRSSEEEFDLPDFVWSCGNSEVMSYVKRLMAENQALKKAPRLNGSPAQSVASILAAAMPDTCPKEPFNTQHASAESVMAFACTVGDTDSHQITPVLVLLEQHKDDLEVCSKLCASLENLTFQDNDNREIITRSGGVEAVLQVLKQHQAVDGTLLRPVLDALWNITFDDEAVDRATNAGAIEIVADVMNVHGHSAGLQAGACAVFLNLAVREENRWRIVRGDGAGLIAKAMERHPQDEDVLEQGCQALYMLGYHPDIRPLVAAANGGVAAGLAASYQGGTGRAQKWGKWLSELLNP